MTQTPYIGRFAPSPTGPLHTGSLVAALASYLDALMHGGTWLLRIDDADLSRVQAGAADAIAAQLKHYGFVWHGKISHTQDNRALHAAALAQLQCHGKVYACACTRADLANLPSSDIGERVYDARCRDNPMTLQDIRALRLRVDNTAITFTDRRCGEQTQDLARQVGDFVLWRPESVVGYVGGLYNYQLTMPVDDAAAGVTHVVRGADLLGNTARQLYIYDLLGLSRPSYLHVPLVLGADGAKLSKQHGAAPLAYLPSTDPLPVLNQALQHLGCERSTAVTQAAFWCDASLAWAQKNGLSL
jgi:glutamyl-Q tRNA(Asp) synthetase